MALCLGLALPAHSASDEATAAAWELYEMGLFQGVGISKDGTTEFALDRTPTRAEAVTMLVRLLGKEAEATARSWASPFSDVPDWAAPYVGYAYANGLTSGVSVTEFGTTQEASAGQYLTFLLRALGYDSEQDFRWDSPWTLTDTLGITDGTYRKDSVFTRGDVALVSLKALDTNLKALSTTLRSVVENNLGINQETLAVQRVNPLEGSTYYDYAESFANGYAFAIKGMDCGYIDAFGVFTPCYKATFYAKHYGDDNYFTLLQMLETSKQPQFSISEDGVYPYYDDTVGTWGYKTIHSGETVLSPAYAQAFPFAEGRAVVVEAGTQATWVINSAGKQLFQLEYVFETSYQDSLLNAAVSVKGVVCNCLLSRDGRVMANLGQISEINRGLSIRSVVSPDVGYDLRGAENDPERIGVCVEGTGQSANTVLDFYYMNTSGTITVSMPDGAQAGLAWGKGETAAFYCVDGMYGLFDEGGLLTDPIFVEVGTMRGGVAFVSEDGVKYYLLDDAGKRVGSASFRGGGTYGDQGLIPAEKNDLWGYITKTGKTVFDFTYAEASPFSEGIAFVRTKADAPLTIINVENQAVTTGLTVLEYDTVSEGFYLINTPQGYCHIYAVY